MPELPEVEFARRNFLRWTKGAKISAAFASRTRILGGAAPATFVKRVVGARVIDAERRGKNVVVELDRGGEPIGLRFHLGMTGKIVRRKIGDPPPRFSRAWMSFNNGATLHFLDTRMFGKLEAGPLELMREGAFEGLGPDPLVDGLDGPALEKRFGSTTLAIKLALMDQSKIAGVGNILASESLWRAKVSPKRRTGSLTKKELQRLAEGVLESIAHTLDEEEGDEIAYVEEGGENPFVVYGRAGEKCPRCRAPIARIVQGARSTFFCRKCQK